MNGWITIGTKLDTKGFDKQIEYIKKRMEEIEDLLSKADLGYDVGDVLKLEAEYEKLGNKLMDLEAKRKKAFESSQLVQDVNKIKTNLEQVGDLSNEISINTKEVKNNMSSFNISIEKGIKKVGKLALAVFSVRSAYMFVRQAVSTLSQYDEQLATDIEFIR